MWQGLASVLIPGFTINRICWISDTMLTKLKLIPGNKVMKYNSKVLLV